MPGKRWKGGVKGWEVEMADCIQHLRESLVRAPSPTAKRADLILRDGAFVSTRLHLGLFEWWLGNETVARELFAEAATGTEALLARWLPQCEEDYYTAYVDPAQMGAMAASLAGNQSLAQKLFAQTELLATALLSSDETAPGNYYRALDYMSGSKPYIRAWCLIRLGRFSGFHGYRYTVPLAQARKAAPVWQRMDIHQLLDTANFCYELWRPKRGGEDYLKQKKFEPLLRALVACLSPGAGEPERLAARKALQSYQDSIHDMYYFYEIYPRVLDMRAAWPHLFG
jgi:hypothetical protein